MRSHGLVALTVLASCAAPVPEAEAPSLEPGPEAVETKAAPVEEAVSPSTSPAPVQPASRRGPAWIRRGVELNGASGFAVGRAPPMKNRGLARSVASNRARARLARALSERNGSERARGETFAHTTAIEIDALWTDPVTGAMFARARVSVEDAPTRP